MLIRIERDEIVDVYTEVGGPCGRQPPLFYGLVGSIGVIGDDVIRLLVLIERGSWKNLRKNRKIFKILLAVWEIRRTFALGKVKLKHS
jgi:hypothetical protein